jgi:Ala-tRNA(Pro) deacylase
MSSASDVLDRLRKYLKDEGVTFREVHHAETFTSEESARARGEDLRIGGKALLIKADKDFKLFVLSAAARLDSGALKRELGLRKMRFATPEELLETTGLVPGAVPPFGQPILPFELFVDATIASNEKIAFNAGSLTDSIIISVEDYLRVSRPRLMKFSISETA